MNSETNFLLSESAAVEVVSTILRRFELCAAKSRYPVETAHEFITQLQGVLNVYNALSRSTNQRTNDQKHQLCMAVCAAQEQISSRRDELVLGALRGVGQAKAA